MATDKLIGSGSLDLDVQTQMYDSFPDDLMYDESDPASVIAALLWLDQRYGVHQSTDRVVINPAIGSWLVMQWPVVSPPRAVELMAVFGRLAEGTEDADFGSEDDRTLNAAAEELSTTWFQVEFVSSDAGRCHPILEGRKVTLRFMTAAETAATEASGDTCLTVREADGSVVELTSPNQPRFL